VIYQQHLQPSVGGPGSGTAYQYPAGAAPLGNVQTVHPPQPGRGAALTSANLAHLAPVAAVPGHGIPPQQPAAAGGAGGRDDQSATFSDLERAEANYQRDRRRRLQIAEGYIATLDTALHTAFNNQMDSRVETIRAALEDAVDDINRPTRQ